VCVQLRTGNLRPLSRQFLDDRLCRPNSNADIILCCSHAHVREANWDRARGEQDVYIIRDKHSFPSALYTGCTVRFTCTSKTNVYVAGQTGTFTGVVGNTRVTPFRERDVWSVSTTAMLTIRLTTEGRERVIRISARPLFGKAPVELAYGMLATHNMGSFPKGISVHFRADAWRNRPDLPYVVFASVGWKQLTTTLCSAQFEPCRALEPRRCVTPFHDLLSVDSRP